MIRTTWAKHVPDTADPPVARTLAYDLLLQQNIPVHIELVNTASGGTTVSLPAAFVTQIDGDESQYHVAHSKQTFAANCGDLYIEKDGAAETFKLRAADETTPVSVLVMVFWIPPVA